MKSAQLKRQEIGLGGWVEDIVLRLGGYSGPAGLRDLRDDLGYLAQVIWGTSYKTSPIPLPVTASPLPWTGAKDISIRSRKCVNGWLEEASSLFQPAIWQLGPRLFAELVASDQTGAFVSSEGGGLAILVLDRRRNFREI